MRWFQRCAADGGPVLVCALLATGCGQPVREDRAISFAPDQRAGFQHGRDGVYIADPAGGPPVRIFQPAPDVIAVSPPQWSSDGKKLIFTSARSAPSTFSVNIQMPVAPAANGTVYHARPVTYTCWLRDESAADKTPKKLFESDLQHPGYVAANLAVRWTPQGDGVLFLAPDGKLHELRRFDLKTGTSTRAFPHAADAFLFDVAPSGSLCCLLGTQTPGANDGIWIGPEDGSNWWHVPGSDSPPPTNLNSPLERLRASRPAWTTDGKRFAFVSHQPNSQPDEPAKYLLKIGTSATRVVTTRLEDETPLRDVRWSPDGRRLGYLREDGPTTFKGIQEQLIANVKQRNIQEEDAEKEFAARMRQIDVLPQLRDDPLADLQLIDAEAGKPMTVAKSVRTFVGWDATGKHTAYVDAGRRIHRAGEGWALLFIAREDARNAVIVADVDGKNPMRLVDGWHATFPRWSPTDARLSLWLTFESPYTFGRPGGGALPGDPAALLDAADGKLHWEPVNAREKAQLAHDLLRRRDYAGAWKRYAEIEDDKTLADAQEIPLYIAHCLNKLGRRDDAKARLDRFRHNAPVPAPIFVTVFQPSAAPPGATPNPVDIPFARDCLAAEVFLSLDEPDEALKFLQQSRRDASDEESRCYSAVVLAQVLLLLDRRADYLDALTQTLMPSFVTAWPKVAAERRDSFLRMVGVTALPGASPDFLAAIPAEKLRVFPQQWDALRPRAADPAVHLVIDTVREALMKKLGQEAERRKVAALLEANPARAQYLPDGVDKLFWEIRFSKPQILAFMELFGN